MLVALLAIGPAASVALAVTVSEPFSGATAPGWTFSGSAVLTGTGVPDPVGAGWLRLNPASGGQGYAYHSEVLPISQPISVTFNFANYGGSNPTADGLTFFLFDAGAGFSTGFGGGGMGYENMPTGALAVGIADGFPSSFVSGIPNSIAIRGPAPGTAFVSGTAGLSPTPATPARGLTPADPNFRQLTITMVPAGAGALALTVQLQTGATVATVLSGVVVSGLPANVRFGLSASTGAFTNIHEVRNFTLTGGILTATEVPTLSEWGVVLLAAMLLAGSFAALRRR